MQMSYSDEDGKRERTLKKPAQKVEAQVRKIVRLAKICVMFPGSRPVLSCLAPERRE